MERLLKQITLLKDGPAGSRIRSRMEEFRSEGEEPEEEIFKEMCFCLLTANCSAEGAIRIQAALGDGFASLPERRLASKLKMLGYRFPNVRARYISEARRHIGTLKNNIRSRDIAARDWLADNVLGLGYKEASHFLRNIGRDDHAIIDFHIIDLLAGRNIIERPKTMTRKRYLEIEQKLARLAGKAGISQGELDLYLWYMETGKILK